MPVFGGKTRLPNSQKMSELISFWIFFYLILMQAPFMIKSAFHSLWVYIKGLLGALQGCPDLNKIFNNMNLVSECPKNNFSPLFSANLEIIEDRQSYEILRPFKECAFFSSLNFLPPCLLPSKGNK
jgi:hypothetical protein